MLRSALPILAWLPRYERRWLRFDALAAAALWAMLIPQAIGYASLAGVPPDAGLYSALLAAPLYAVFATSRDLNVGPSSTVAILSAATVAPIAAGSGASYVALTAMLALLAGGVLVVAGLLRLGFLADFLARPVILGFVIGVALVIAVGQLPKLLGLTIESGNFFEELWRLLASLGEIHRLTAAVGLASLALLVLLDRFVPKAPGALVTLVAAIGISAALDLEARGVSIVGEVPSGLPGVSVPEIGLGHVLELVPGALAIAVVAFAESIAVARSFASKRRYEVDANRELVALGAANVGTGLVAGLPVDGSLSRTAVADRVGSRTQLAGILCAGLVLVTVLVLTPLFTDLPTATVAAIVIAAVMKLPQPRPLIRLYRLDRDDFTLAAICLLGVLLVGTLPGILVAVVVSLVMLVRRSYRPRVVVLGRAPERSEHDEDYRFRDVERHPEYVTSPGLIVVRFDGELFFANANYFRERVRALVAAAVPPAATVLVDFGAVSHVDTSAAEMLEELRVELAEAGVELALARVKSPVHDALARCGFVERLGPERIYGSVWAGVNDLVR